MQFGTALFVAKRKTAQTAQKHGAPRLTRSVDCPKLKRKLSRYGKLTNLGKAVDVREPRASTDTVSLPITGRLIEKFTGRFRLAV